VGFDKLSVQKVIQLIEDDSYISQEKLEREIDRDSKKFLLDNRLLQMHYLEGFDCEQCEELCHLSIQRIDEEVFADCPTGYAKRQYLKLEEINGYRFSKDSLFSNLKSVLKLSKPEAFLINGFKILGNNEEKQQAFVYKDKLPENYELILQDLKRKQDSKSICVLVNRRKVKIVLNKSFESPNKQYFIKSSRFLETQLEIYLSGRKVLYKSQKVVFGKSKKLFQWFYHLAIKPNKGYSLKETADLMQGAVINESNIRTNRSRILKLFKEQTSINHTEINPLIFFSSDCFKLCLEPEQVKIFEA